jgi:hypothetical protein
VKKKFSLVSLEFDRSLVVSNTPAISRSSPSVSLGTDGSKISLSPIRIGPEGSKRLEVQNANILAAQYSGV